jgi:hypothetical protein
MRLGHGARVFVDDNRAGFFYDQNVIFIEAAGCLSDRIERAAQRCPRHAVGRMAWQDATMCGLA